MIDWNITIVKSDEKTNVYEENSCVSSENCHKRGADGSLIQIESFPSYNGNKGFV